MLSRPAHATTVRGAGGSSGGAGEAKRCDKCKDTTTSCTCALKNRPIRREYSPGQRKAGQSQQRRRSAQKRRNEVPSKLTASLRKFLARSLSACLSRAYLLVAHLALVFTRENGSTWHTYCFASAREIRRCISWTAQSVV